MGTLNFKAYQTLKKFNALVDKIPHRKKLFLALALDEAVASVGPKKEQGVVQCQKVLADLFKPRVLNTAFLLKIHRKMMKGQVANPQDLGKLRNRQNWIGPEGESMKKARFIPPPASEVSRLMQDLQEYLLRKDEDPLIQLAVYFAKLLMVHPFMDGNGRVARIFLITFLHQKGLTKYPVFYLSGYFKRHHREYYNRLLNITKKGEWEAWIEFFLKGCVEEGKNLCQKIAGEKTPAGH